MRFINTVENISWRSRGKKYVDYFIYLNKLLFNLEKYVSRPLNLYQQYMCHFINY